MTSQERFTALYNEVRPLLVEARDKLRDFSHAYEIHSPERDDYPWAQIHIVLQVLEHRANPT